MECKCKIKSVLSEEETKFVKDLYRYLNKDGPETDRLALLDDKTVGVSCRFLYRWGFKTFCANEEVIERFLQKK